MRCRLNYCGSQLPAFTFHEDSHLPSAATTQYPTNDVRFQRKTGRLQAPCDCRQKHSITVTSEHIMFLLFSFSLFLRCLVVGSVR